MLGSAAAALLALAAPAGGQWLKLFDEPGETTWLDRSAAKAGAGEAMVWIRHDYPKPRPDGARSVRDQWHVDCGQRSFTVFAVLSYDARGRLLKAQAIPAAERHSAPLLPGSRMQKVFSAVCG